MREQELEQLAKEEAEAVEQFKREQDLFETKVLLGDSKAKVGLSFMYDAPAGLKQVIFDLQSNAKIRDFFQKIDDTFPQVPYYRGLDLFCLGSFCHMVDLFARLFESKSGKKIQPPI